MLKNIKQGDENNMVSKVLDTDLREEISVYARISVDMEKESDDNISIENQLKIVHSYIKQHFPNCTYKEYIDRDRSGYTFEQRENYQQMRERLLSGKSSILIVKDFSRFSRRTSLGLWELEQMRDSGVRIISVMDACDYPTNDDWLSISIRFMTNELPVTDTSKKVKRSINAMQKEGEWLCAVPYGYIIMNQKRGIIDIVPDEAEVIKEIFRLYSQEGWGYKKIANYLTEKKIPTPRMKEKFRAEEEEKEYKRTVKSEWSIITIQTILHNDYYIGVFRGHKYERKKINGVDVKINEEEHYVINNHHKSIIDDKTFLFTQEQLKTRTQKNIHYRGVRKYETPYTGYLFCGDCQAPMFSRSRPDLDPSYICGSYHKRGLKGCSSSHHIKLDFLDGILKDYIKLVKLNCSSMIEELEKSIANETSAIQNNEKVIQTLEKQILLAKEELKSTKKQKIKDIARNEDDAELIEETYLEIENEIAYRIKGLQEQLRHCLNKKNDILEVTRLSKTVLDVFDDIIKKPRLDKIDIALIVDKIFVYESGDVEVNLKADVESLLQTGTLPNEEKSVNFQFDSIDNSFITTYNHTIPKRRDKVYTVNIINGGSPSQIMLTEIERNQNFISGIMSFSSRIDIQQKGL